MRTSIRQTEFDFGNQTLSVNGNIVHVRENNSESQQTLDENREKFSHDCKRVYEMLKGGARLSVKGALLSGISGHLPRRIKDLKEAGVDIKTEWIKKENGKRGYVEYFIEK